MPIVLASAIPAMAQTNDTPADSVTYTLGEVVVRANPRITTLKGNALCTRIAGTYLEHAGTANDVLKQVPMVQGTDGNFEVFGKGSPAIYVNGRLLQDVSELGQINSSNIKKVEVVTSPGAKYDASVKAVINITLKAPQGDGFSGIVRSQGAVQKYGRTADLLNLKYRRGGLEVFGNFGYFYGKMQDESLLEIVTRSSATWYQRMQQGGYGKIHDFFGKTGFSYIFNPRHSIGAYYNVGFKKTDGIFDANTKVLMNDAPYDDLSVNVHTQSDEVPLHHANMYYSGKIGEFGIDFNMDYMWRKKSYDLFNNENSASHEDTQVQSSTTNRSRMLAEKLVLSYPLWGCLLEVGQEYTSSRFASDYTTNSALVTSVDSRVDENNLAGFIQMSRSFGHWNVGVGVRYEHVAFKYLENGQNRDDMSRSYNNVFPSVSASAMIDKVQMAFSYTHKTQRPSYHALDGNIDYVNRFTLEGGNPYLKPEKIHDLQLSGT